MSNSPISTRSWLYLPFFWLASCLACHQSAAQKAPEAPPPAPRAKLQLPIDLPEWAETDTNPQLAGRPVTIVPEIQSHLQKYIRNGGNPIAALVMADVKTGEILAMVQGKDPRAWGADTHSALHIGFPAASLFKTIVAAASFEIVEMDPEETLSMFGGCSHVYARGIWPPSESRNPSQGLSLRRAYGHSCNGFFAKLAVNRIGLGPILGMARKFGWNSDLVATDFHLPPSPLREPNAASSSIHTIGKFAAGFGSVGISAVHGMWQNMVIANDGMTVPIHLFRDSPRQDPEFRSRRAIESATATNLRRIMDATVTGGTASSAFNRGRFRMLRTEVGGKTGTLTGNHPHGLTTLFTGLYPLENPEVAVASVVLLEDLWRFKATNLAAEAIMAYFDYKNSPDSPLKTARATEQESSSR